MKSFTEFGMRLPEILLPANKDLKSWSVIACDQYTQDIDYWKSVEKNAEGKPSCLNMILPEVYLASPDRQERIQKIRNTMNEYLASGIFSSPEKEFIYIERKTGYGRIRCGLVTAIDLETYEWKPFSKALIRATEATIVDRIPPRMEIRRGAAIESPHIMLLVNDADLSIVEKAGAAARKSSPVYDGDLMLDSGHITGWKIQDEASLDSLYDSLKQYAEKNTSSDGSTFMFAVGDGNHSLATAKAVWDEYKQKLIAEGKSEEELKDCNVRYALVEIVNIYDKGLTFEPIHRVLFNSKAVELYSFIQEKLGGKVSECKTAAELEEKVKESKASFGFVYTENGNTSYVLLETPVKELAVSRLQPEIDKFINEKNENSNGENKISIDYIHGTEEVFRLGSREDAVTILLPPIAKDSFFATINTNGPLPRKSFSMGEASEKRFYLECRKLF